MHRISIVFFMAALCAACQTAGYRNGYESENQRFMGPQLLENLGSESDRAGWPAGYKLRTPVWDERRAVDMKSKELEALGPEDSYFDWSGDEKFDIEDRISVEKVFRKNLVFYGGERGLVDVLQLRVFSSIIRDDTGRKNIACVSSLMGEVRVVTHNVNGMVLGDVIFTFRSSPMKTMTCELSDEKKIVMLNQALVTQFSRLCPATDWKGGDGAGRREGFCFDGAK